jgi:hypothetical protein
MAKYSWTAAIPAHCEIKKTHPQFLSRTAGFGIFAAQFDGNIGFFHQACQPGSAGVLAGN